MRRTCGFLFIILLQFTLVLAFLYMGLNMAERGTQQLLGLAQEGRAFSFNEGETGLIITFAGRDYFLPWKQYWEQLHAIISVLKGRFLD